MRRLVDVWLSKIPSDCPFNRDIVVFGRTLCTVPPLCKLNPFYDLIIKAKVSATERLANPQDN